MKLIKHFPIIVLIGTAFFSFQFMKGQTPWCATEARRLMELQTIPDGENLQNQAEMCSLIVTDILGREAYSAQINPAQMQFVINTKDWAVGLYTYKIVVPNSSMEFNGKFDVVH